MSTEAIEQIELIDLVQVAGKKLRQRTERKWPHRFRSGNPLNMVARSRAQDLVDQSGFSDPRPPRHQHTWPVRGRDGVGNETPLLGSPDHGPSVHES
jgi:hypothetical protein